MPPQTSPTGAGAIMNLAQQEVQNTSGGASNTTSPFTINPGTGQFTSNPGFLNAVQQLDLYLTQNPDAAAEIQAEESNAQQNASIVPTSDLQNYRDPNTGQPPEYGITYGQLAQQGFVPMNAQQQQQNLGIQNAQSAIGSATNASNNVSTVTVDIGDALSKLGLGFIANALPGYSTYKQAVGSLGQNPQTAAAAPIFGSSGVTPSQAPGSPLSSFLGNLGVLSRGNVANNTPTHLPSSTFKNPIPESLLSMSPYNATANPIVSGQQTGANARRSQGIQ
jgi:hypothetical protein